MKFSKHMNRALVRLNSLWISTGSINKEMLYRPLLESLYGDLIIVTSKDLREPDLAGRAVSLSGVVKGGTSPADALRHLPL